MLQLALPPVHIAAERAAQNQTVWLSMVPETLPHSICYLIEERGHETDEGEQVYSLSVTCCLHCRNQSGCSCEPSMLKEMTVMRMKDTENLKRMQSPLKLVAFPLERRAVDPEVVQGDVCAFCLHRSRVFRIQST